LFEDELHLETNLPTIDIIKKFIDLLEANFANELSVGFYAAQLNVHPNHLNSLIKKHICLKIKDVYLLLTLLKPFKCIIFVLR